MKEMFKADDIEQISIQKLNDDEYHHFLNMIKVDGLRKHKIYIWAIPIKWENKTTFAWEIEFADGQTKSFGYCGEHPEIPSYELAIEKALQYLNETFAFL